MAPETSPIICCTDLKYVYILATQVATKNSEMAEYFEKNGKFVFPDAVFPKSDLKNLPESPEIASNKLAAEFESINSKPEGAQVECAAKILFHAEVYGSISDEIVQRACTLLESLMNSNASAAYILGNWYMFGLFGRVQAKKRAKEYYRESIKLGGIRAWYRLGSSAEEKNDIEMAVSRYECGAKHGDAACLYRLAIAILKGQFGYPKDAQKAMNLLEKACEKADEDFPQPLFLSGMILVGEVEQGAVAPNHARGFERIQKAAKLHFAPALIRMTAAYQQNILPYDCAVVVTYLHCAARQERFLVFQKMPPQFSGDAEIQLSKFFLCGSRPTLEPNEEWAYKFAVASVEHRNATAQFAVGYYAEAGIYIRRDLQLATTMYEQASLNNCEAATERLAKFRTDAAGCVDLKRSTTLTRRDHDVALQRALSKAPDNGRNLSMRNIVQSLGQQLAQSEASNAPPSHSAAGALRIDLSEAKVPSVPKNPLDSVSAPQSDLNPLKSPSSSNSSLTAISGPSKPPYPATTATVPYPSDRPSGNLQQPTQNIKLVSQDDKFAGPAGSGEVNTPAAPTGTPYQDGEEILQSNKSTGAQGISGYPFSPVELKSPYPLSPPKPAKTVNNRVSGYPDDNVKVQKSVVYIPESPNNKLQSPSPQASPKEPNQPQPRSTSPFRSLSSQFSAPMWMKGHSRSRSASPERTPSPSRRSTLSLMSKLKNRLSIGGGLNPEDMFAPIDFDQQPQKEQNPPRSSMKNSSISQADTIPGSDLNELTFSPPKRGSLPLTRPATFDVSLGSIAEDKDRAVAPAINPPPPGVGSRSGSPVQRKPIGTPEVIPKTSSWAPSPDRPASPFVNGIKPSTSSKQIPLAAENMGTPINPNTGVGVKRASAGSRPRGHKYTMSTVASVNGKRIGADIEQPNRAVSTTLRSTMPAHAASSPALKHHALSFDEMGIQTVVEEKGGPCVIA